MVEIEKVVKNNEEVWSNSKMDEFRKEGCFNCGTIKDCSTAKHFMELV